MAIKKSQIEKWIVAQKKHRLSDTHVQMARELGLNPDKLGKIDNHRQEPWKAPLPEFIEEIFYKRFKKERPDVVKPLKQILKEQEIKTKTKKKEKEIRRKEREQEQINNGTDEVLTFQSPTSITEKKRSHSSGTGTIFHPYKTAEKCCTNKRDESHIGQYNTFLFSGFEIGRLLLYRSVFLLSDLLKGSIYHIIVITVINTQCSHKAVQCPNCVQTLFHITFIRIAQDIYRTGQMPFHLLQCR